MKSIFFNLWFIITLRRGNAFSERGTVYKATLPIYTDKCHECAMRSNHSMCYKSPCLKSNRRDKRSIVWKIKTGLSRF